MVLHDRERDHVDRHEFREKPNAIDDPLAPRRILEERLPPHAPRDAVIHAGVGGIDDVRTTTGHAAESSGIQGWAAKFDIFSEDSDRASG